MNNNSEKILHKKEKSTKNESEKSNSILNKKLTQDEGADMDCSDFVIENEITAQDGLLTDSISFLTETNSENGNNGNNGHDEKLVYFAIEKKWVKVGPGVFRK